MLRELYDLLSDRRASETVKYYDTTSLLRWLSQSPILASAFSGHFVKDFDSELETGGWHRPCHY